MWKYLIICAVISAQAQANPRNPTYSPHHHQAARSTSDATLATIRTATIIPPVQRQNYEDRRQTLCLALGMYHEARGEAENGRLAVGLVILNRIHANGLTICQTVWQTDQFSFTRKPARALTPREQAAWCRVQEMAVTLRAQKPDDITNGAMQFYNARLVHPKWKGEVTIRIGDHVFMRPLTPAPSSANVPDGNIDGYGYL